MGQDLLCRGLEWVVGSGLDRRVWDDQWMPTNEIQFLGIPLARKEDCRVRNLMKEDGTGWDRTEVHEVF